LSRKSRPFFDTGDAVGRKVSGDLKCLSADFRAKGDQMPIDDPFDALQQQYPEQPDADVASALELVTQAAAGLGIPLAGALNLLFGFMGRFDTATRLERVQAFIRELLIAYRGHDLQMARMRTDITELQSAMQLAVSFDLNEFDDPKRSRYVNLLRNASFSETRVHDVVTFIQDIERLGERELIGLRVLNKVMNKQGDWQSTVSGPTGSRPTLHPNTFIQRSQELAVQMTSALSPAASLERNQFNREEGLQICLRLQGFGLAQMIQTEPRQVPITNYCARPTPRGLMLLRLLDEDVPNWDRYFDENGPL
jgi:hypothetical protein